MLCKVTPIGSTDENLGIFRGLYLPATGGLTGNILTSTAVVTLHWGSQEGLWREPGRVSLSERFMVGSLMAASVTTNSTANACQEAPAVSKFCSAGRNKTGQIDLAALT